MIQVRTKTFYAEPEEGADEAGQPFPSQPPIILKVSALPARQANDVFLRLGKVVSPPLANALGLFQGGTTLDLLKLDMGQAASALLSFFGAVSKSDMDFLIDNLLGPAIVNNAKCSDVMDVVFQGRLLNLYEALYFCIEVNFRHFFSAGRRKLAGLQAAPKTDSTSKAA